MEQMIYGHVGGTVQDPRSAKPHKPSPLEDLSTALQRVPVLRDRVLVLAEKLCGPLPPEGTSAGKQLSEHGGIYGAVEEEARRLNNWVDDMNVALARIERGLP